MFYKIKLIIKFAILLTIVSFLCLFVIHNPVSVELNLYPFGYIIEIKLVILILLALFIGFVLSFFADILSFFRKITHFKIRKK